MKPCGTTAAYRRHLRNGEVPCDPCREAANAYRNQYLRKRPTGRRIVVHPGQRACEPLGRHGAMKGKPTTGTPTGYARHYRAGEPPCVECRTAYNAQQRARREKPRKRRPRRGPEPPGTGLPTPRHEPRFTGSKQVVCACGARGHVNRGLLKAGQGKVEECCECR